MRWCFAHNLFSTFTIMLVFCAQFVFYFYYFVGVLHTICFLLLLLCWCFGHYLFSIFANTLVFCALFFFYFKYHVGVLRAHCFLLSLLRWCFAHYFFSTFTIWCFANYLFSTLTITSVCCALFVFYFNYYVSVLRTICFLL